MNKRRVFIKLAGTLALGSLLAPTRARAFAKKPIGLQLYSLRKHMREDPKDTLLKVANLGYKHLESASYQDGKVYGMDPLEFKSYVENLDMKLQSAHVGGPEYVSSKHGEAIDFWKKAVADHEAMGAKFIIKPSMPKPQTLQELQVWCDYYNAVGELAKDGGLMFGFHNHAREFEKIEDKVMMDYMIENTDPKLVCFELDVYWSQKGGQPAADYLARYPGRFPVLHIKDEQEIGASGTIDFKPIFEAAYKQGMRDFYVEVERYNFDPIESVKKSFDYLNTAAYVK